MKKTATTDTEITNINRQCYDTLGDSYVDGAGDLDTLIRIGTWQEFINLGGGGEFLKCRLRYRRRFGLACRA